MPNLLKDLYTLILEGERIATRAKVEEALQARLPVAEILETMIAAMHEVGQRYEAGEYFVPEMLIAARAMQHGMDLLRPHLAGSGVRSSGKVVIGTVKGDLHDIGKNLVGMMLEGAGFEIVDLGVDVPVEGFLQAVQTQRPQIVALSALLTTTLPYIQTIIESLQAAGLRQGVKIMIGGAPVGPALAQQFGADGYAPDAAQAVRVAKELVG